MCSDEGDLSSSKRQLTSQAVCTRVWSHMLSVIPAAVTMMSTDGAKFMHVKCFPFLEARKTLSLHFRTLQAKIEDVLKILPGWS